MLVTQDNYKLIAAKLYRSPLLSIKEFETDLGLVKRVSRALAKFNRTGSFRALLHYNNLRIACNCFGEEFVIKYLCLCAKDNVVTLSTFLAFLGYADRIVVNSSLVIVPGEQPATLGLQKILIKDLAPCL